MKTLLALAMVLGFSAISANAQAACTNGDTQRWPSNNPALRQGEYPQDVTWTCVNGKYVEEYTAPAPQYRGCVEGDLQRFPVSDSRTGGENGFTDELFVCHNGKYVQAYPSNTRAVPRGGKKYVCKNGSQMYFEENDSNAGGESGTVRVLYTCRNGRFVRN